ncbi:ABC transporter permease [Catellatospora aurea]|uniref:ABC transporter permease n=1 Tax=Catellatospora aurea TaxID=1337874 RepID=A0ABW2GYQ8_9ACTN
MTAPASTYPRTASDLLPLARQMAQRLGEIPSRNSLMSEFRIGAPKAGELRGLLAADTAGTLPAQPSPELITGGPDTHPAPDPSPSPETAAAPITVETLPLTAVDGHPDTKIAPAVAEPVAAPAAAVRPKRRIRSWPVFIIGLGAFVGIWSGWVELGKLTGFGVVHPLPGIADGFSLNTAITLPLGMEAYAAYALKVWMSTGIPARARSFARWSTIVALLVGMAGQVAYHLMSAADMASAPWQITTAVACLPVVVLGLAATLAHLVANGDEEDAR